VSAESVEPIIPTEETPRTDLKAAADPEPQSEAAEGIQLSSVSMEEIEPPPPPPQQQQQSATKLKKRKAKRPPTKVNAAAEEQQQEGEGEPQDQEEQQPDNLRLRAELEALKLSELKRRAREAGVPDQELDEADDSVDVKGAVISLILLARRSSSGVDEAAIVTEPQQQAPDGDEEQGQLAADPDQLEPPITPTKATVGFSKTSSAVPPPLTKAMQTHAQIGKEIETMLGHQKELKELLLQHPGEMELESMMQESVSVQQQRARARACNVCVCVCLTLGGAAVGLR
jgi:hypothetical protein